MSDIKKKQYEKQRADCNNLCEVNTIIQSENELMKCVRCPFCSETVDAILTSTHIACPKCKTEVRR